MASEPKKKRSIYGLLARQWAWVIVLALLVTSGIQGYRVYQIGLPEAAHMLVPIATNIVIIALVLSVRYIVIEGLLRGIRKGMQQSDGKDDTKADQVASSVGRTTGRYAGIAGRALSQGARKVSRVTRAGAAAIRQSTADHESNRSGNSTPSKSH